MKRPLAHLRHCLEGPVYPALATCAPDGTPNVGFLSYVNLVDDGHVALAFRFLDKTARNIAANPRVALLLTDARTCRQHALELEYLRTESAGPLFEQMRVRFEAAAALSGMTAVVQPTGVQIYRVLGLRALDRGYVPEPAEPTVSASAVRQLSAKIGACEDLSTLLDVTLAGLAEHLHYEHAIVLLADADNARLYAVASHGYPQSGAGAEVAFGDGAIGVAATARHPVRIAFAARDRMVNRWLQRRGDAGSIERNIALVGLPDAQSKLAVPVLARGRLLGVLYLESAQASRFLEDDEKTLIALAGHLGSAILLCSQAADAAGPTSPAARAAAASGAPLPVRRYEEDQSIFIGDDYLIKGVAGAILWKLLTVHAQEGRTEFSNRELRLDRAIGLPESGDNLEARLVLLRRRLQDRCTHIGLERIARGRVRLTVARPLELQSVPRA